MMVSRGLGVPSCRNKAVDQLFNRVYKYTKYNVAARGDILALSAKRNLTYDLDMDLVINLD